MDYIEEYLKYIMCDTNIRIEDYKVKGDRVTIDYILFHPPLYSVCNRNRIIRCIDYFNWEIIYLRKKKINKIKYGLYTTNPTT